MSTSMKKLFKSALALLCVMVTLTVVACSKKGTGYPDGYPEEGSKWGLTFKEMNGDEYSGDGNPGNGVYYEFRSDEYINIKIKASQFQKKNHKLGRVYYMNSDGGIEKDVWVTADNEGWLTFYDGNLDIGLIKFGEIVLFVEWEPLSLQLEWGEFDIDNFNLIDDFSGKFENGYTLTTEYVYGTGLNESDIPTPKKDGWTFFAWYRYFSGLHVELINPGEWFIEPDTDLKDIPQQPYARRQFYAAWRKV